MDFSEQYIKMCQQAINIQEQWDPKDGDFYLVPSIDIWNSEFKKWEISQEIYLYDIDHSNVFDINGVVKEGIVYLLRQDQLQEMIINNYRCPKDCMVDFYTWLYERPSENKSKMSFEQLWLAFVMNENFNKIWDCEKEDWIDNATKID